MVTMIKTVKVTATLTEMMKITVGEKHRSSDSDIDREIDGRSTIDILTEREAEAVTK